MEWTASYPLPSISYRVGESADPGRAHGETGPGHRAALRDVSEVGGPFELRITGPAAR